MVFNVGDAPGRVGQKRIFAIGPQVCIERIGAFFYVLPEALEQAREIMRQHGFKFQEWHQA